jgi:hypothetical protein
LERCEFLRGVTRRIRYCHRYTFVKPVPAFVVQANALHLIMSEDPDMPEVDAVAPEFGAASMRGRVLDVIRGEFAAVRFPFYLAHDPLEDAYDLLSRLARARAIRSQGTAPVNSR